MRGYIKCRNIAPRDQMSDLEQIYLSSYSGLQKARFPIAKLDWKAGLLRFFPQPTSIKITSKFVSGVNNDKSHNSQMS